MSKTSERAEKEANQRVRECLDETRTHIRSGGWGYTDPEFEITLVGMARDLHGPDGVCTCCPRRQEPTP